MNNHWINHLLHNLLEFYIHSYPHSNIYKYQSICKKLYYFKIKNYLFLVIKNHHSALNLDIKQDFNYFKSIKKIQFISGSIQSHLMCIVLLLFFCYSIQYFKKVHFICYIDWNLYHNTIWEYQVRISNRYYYFKQLHRNLSQFD